MRLNPATRLYIPPLRERRDDLPELVRFALLSALRSEMLRPLVRSFLARFPTPEDFREEHNNLFVGKPAMNLLRRDAFSVFVSRRAMAALCAYDWPGNQRELKMLAANAVVFALTEHLDSAPVGSEEPASPRAPAVLSLADSLIARLLGQAPSASTPARSTGTDLPALASAALAVVHDPGRQNAEPAQPVQQVGDGFRVQIEIQPGPSFVKLSAEVERQYLRAIFRACDGDLSRMAVALLGPSAKARQVHLRLNQLGLKLRELREGMP